VQPAFFILQFMRLESPKKYFVRKVGERLAARRKDQNHAIEQVAGDIGITVDVLTKIEKGSHDMDVNTLLDLCKYYKVRAYDLLDNL
jgi:transcriptional regulator with XRE-family HTH domain